MATATPSRRGLRCDRSLRRDGLDVVVSGRRAATAVTVTLDGDVDVATAPALQQRLEAVLDEGVVDVVVDVGDVPFVDVAGVGVLLRVRSQLSSRGGRLSVIGPCPSLELVTAALGVELLSGE